MPTNNWLRLRPVHGASSNTWFNSSFYHVVDRKKCAEPNSKFYYELNNWNVSFSTRKVAEEKMKQTLPQFSPLLKLSLKINALNIAFIRK